MVKHCQWENINNKRQMKNTMIKLSLSAMLFSKQIGISTATREQKTPSKSQRGIEDKTTKKNPSLTNSYEIHSFFG